MNFKKINDEVFYASDRIIKVDKKDIEFLQAQASKNLRKRARLCSHRSIKDSLHEMLIIHAKGIYVRPHKHPKKIESTHMIEGELKIVVFKESGDILEVIRMGDYRTGETFYYRLPAGCFHTVIPVSNSAVFHETTEGPFRRKDTLFAPWAPEDNEEQARTLYLNKLIAGIEKKR